MATAGAEPLTALATILGPLLGRQLSGEDLARASSLGTSGWHRSEKGKNKPDLRAELMSRLEAPRVSEPGEKLKSAVRGLSE